MKKVLLFASVCAVLPLVSAAERFQLASGGKALARIVLEEKPTKAAWFGAFELRHHLKLMTGADFEIVAGGSAEPGRTILVGATPFSKFKPSDFASQQYAVDVRADAIELVGFDGDDRGKPSYAVKDGQVVYSGAPDVYAPQGTMYAVYEFLERTCGVRWCNATDFGTVVPRNADLSVALACRRGEPAMRYRGGTAAYGSSAIYWASRSDEAKSWRELAYAEPKRESASRRLFALRHRSGGENAPANHSFYHFYDRYWLTNAADFVEYHPEIFAQGYGSDQKNLPPQLCYANPKTVEVTVREIRQYFDNGGFKKPMRNIAQKGWNWGEGGFALEPMDNSSFCRCDACRKLYEPGRKNDSSEHSTVWFRFVNAVAREIKKSHPTKKIRTLAYMTHEGLPTDVRLEDNVQVYFCLSCNREAPRGRGFDAQCRRLKEWHRAYPDMELGVWLYDVFPLEGAINGGYQCVPGYFAHANAEQFRFLRENGVGYVQHCGYSGEVCQYVTYALMLDPSRSADELLDEYFSMFGAAARPLRRFYDVVEARWCDGKLRKPENPIRNPATHWGTICPPETMAELAKLVAAAERLAATPEEKRRVELFRRSEWEWMKRGSDTYLQRSSAPMPDWTARRIAPVEDGAIAQVPWADLPQIETPLYERGSVDICPDIGLLLRLAHDGKFLYLEIEQRRDLACANIVGHEASGPRDNLELVVARQRALPYRWYHARPNAPFFAASYGEVNFRNHVLSKETCGDAAFYAKSESVIREPDRWIQRFSFPLEHLTDTPLRPGDAFYLTPALCANSRLLKRAGGQYCVFTPVSFATVHTVDRAARVVLEAAESSSSGAFSFARDGRALAEIVVAPQATRSARFGALELQAHLKAITGADFAIVTPTNRTPGLKPVYVGESEPERRLAPSVETFARQELLVSVRHDAVVLVGADDPDFCTNGVPKMSCLTLSSFGTLSGIPARWSIHGTLDAVYEFLENDCGVCWFDDSDDGTDYMENPSLAVPVRTRRVQPFVFCRSLSMDSVLWRRHMDGSVRERLVAYRNAHKPNRWTEAIVNAQRDVFRLRRRVCGEKATCNHSFYDWYDRFLNTNSSAFVAWHPEYFAQDARRQEKGSVFIETAYDPSKRPPQLCYTNPDVIRQVVEDVRSYFDLGGSPVRDKTGKVVRYDPRWGRDSCALEPMDNDGFCQCARCRAEYPDFVTNTSHWAGTTRNDHWFGFVNKVAREIRKSHPAKRVSTLAYMSHTAAPSFRMEDNVIVHFCHHGNRMPQGVSLIARLDRQMKEWKEVLKPGNLGLWFYNCFPHDGVGGMSKDFMCFPGNFLDMHYRQYQDLVKTCQARECVFYCGCTGDLEDYAISRWFWNPDETPETIKARWFSAYGAAGPAVREFYEIIEERFTTPAYYPPKAGHQNEPIAWRYLGTEEVEAKLSACVARAKEATGLTDRQRARLARWLLGTWQYVKDGPRQPLPCASGRAGVLANLTTYKYRAPEPIARDVLKGEKAVCCALGDDRVAGKPQGTTDRLTNGTLTNNYFAVISGKVATNALLAVLKPVDGLRRLRVTVDRGDAQRGRSAFAPVGLVDGKWIDLAGEQITDLWVNGHLTRNVYEFLFLPEAVPAHLDGIGVRDFSTALKRCTTRFALIEAECAPRPGEKVWSIRPEQVKVDFLEHADGRVYVKVGVEGADVLEPVAGIHFVKGPTLWTPTAPIWYPLRVRARTAAGDECVTALEFGIRAEKTKGGRRLQVVRPEGAQAISKANVTEKGVTVK